MIVDLDLNGKKVFIFGGGNEATKKVESMLNQNCKIFVITEKPSDKIINLAKVKKVQLVIARIDQNINLNEYGKAILIVAATNDKKLNRIITQNAKKNRSYAYCVDDPEVSDFSHPSIIKISDIIHVAISTQGKSPLMAKVLRKRLEKVLLKLIDQTDILNVRLQEKMRQLAKTKIPDLDIRKNFLAGLIENKEIQKYLKNNLFENALIKAKENLESF